MSGRSSSSGEGKVVCVTGGSGFIASWLVKLLLQQGYSVNATVRDPCDSKKTDHLLMLDGAKERLHLFKADLLEEGSFDAAVQGCAGVFHTASPVIFSAADPQKEIVDPAVKGTLNVLKSCAKSPSIKRVIVTSSVASMFFTGKPVTGDSVADETWFSDPAVCEKHQMWYQLGKTLAEIASWDFAKENGIDLVVMHPGIVNGPFLQPAPTFSVDLVLNLVNGRNQTYPSYYYCSVDVRDVAEAHIKAFEIESASGRYSLVGSNADFPEVMRIIHQLYPMLHLPNKCAETNSAVKAPTLKASKKKAEEGLGMKFMPLEVSLRDTIECLKEKGFLHF
ncbi:Phenylacetaldehyde reductase [Linum grandiflorum]